MKTFKTLFATETKLMIRDMNNLIFGVGFSVVFAIIMGMVMGGKPAFEGADYSFMEQSFGAVIAIGIGATGLMGLPLALADYRHRKILKRFLVTPVSPGMLLLVQFIVNLLVSVLCLVLVYLVYVLFFDYGMRGSFLRFLPSYLLVILSIYSIGMMLASISPNIKTANLLCCAFYFPMFFFSGTTLPYEIMPAALQRASDILPLTHGIKLMKAASLGLPMEHMTFPVLLMIALAVLCILLSLRFFRWE
ncbi:MAG: ABC transporter permease [Eubacteriales bacterium]|nr:ABC transporter permease [Eubacteriales bacterium]